MDYAIYDLKTAKRLALVYGEDRQLQRGDLLNISDEIYEIKRTEYRVLPCPGSTTSYLEPDVRLYVSAFDDESKSFNPDT